MTNIDKKKIEEEKKKKRTDYKVKDSYNMTVNTDNLVNKDVSLIYSMFFSNDVMIKVVPFLLYIVIN